jgi:hypothetical protein
MTVSVSKRHILLLTATITPGNAPELARADPVARLHDYEASLRYYLTMIDNPLHGIVFVENSNSDVTSLRQSADKAGLTNRVEFLCNYGSFTYAEWGRAYGEFKLLDYAMKNSAMVRDAGKEAVVWKVTGRYKVLNLTTMIQRAPANLDAYVDLKDRPLRWMDMRLMAWTPKGYDRVFLGVADAIGKDLNERAMREKMPEYLDGVALVRRFRNEPRIDGIRGYDNANYSHGFNLLKFYVRSLARICVPWFWI